MRDVASTRRWGRSGAGAAAVLPNAPRSTCPCRLPCPALPATSVPLATPHQGVVDELLHALAQRHLALGRHLAQDADLRAA